MHIPQTATSDRRLNSYRPPTKKSLRTLTTLMTLKPLMILERTGNSPALTAFCLPLSTDLKIFKDFNDFKVPISPNVLFPLKKTPRRLVKSARTRRNLRQESYSVLIFLKVVPPYHRSIIAPTCRRLICIDRRPRYINYRPLNIIKCINAQCRRGCRFAINPCQSAAITECRISNRGNATSNSNSFQIATTVVFTTSYYSIICK